MKSNIVARLLILPLAWLASCSPVRETPAQSTNPARHTTPTPQSTSAAVVAPTPTAQPAESARTTHREIAGIEFVGVAFDARNHRLVVIDQPAGPGSVMADATTAARTHDGLAAINGGFFTPQGEPLGLVIASGKRAGSWNTTSSLGSGIWCADAHGQMRIARRERIGLSAASSMSELIQAGPMLVSNHQAVTGLNAQKSSVRTLILWDGGTRWWIGRTSACTLDQAATAINHGQPADWPVAHALNLDGGRSADLWISETIDGGPLTHRPPWNKPVRNFLILTNR